MPKFSIQILFVIALGLLLFGFFLTTDLLIALGPLRNSLTHVDELVRRTTTIEVIVIKYVFLITGLLIISVIPFRDKLANSAIIKKLSEVKDQKKPFSSVKETVTHPSFLIMTSVIFATSLVYIFGALILSKETLTLIFEEDGIYEYGTAFGFLIAAFFSLKAATALQPFPRKVLSGLLFLGFLLCFGEEISWGQRIFGFQTPETMAAMNIQKETNFHNMLGYFADHLFIAGVFIGGFILPLLANFSHHIRKFCLCFGVPLASGGLAIGFLIASSYHGWTIGKLSSASSYIRPAEVREFFSAVGFILIMFEHYKMAKN